MKTVERFLLAVTAVTRLQPVRLHHHVHYHPGAEEGVRRSESCGLTGPLPQSGGITAKLSVIRGNNPIGHFGWNGLYPAAKANGFALGEVFRQG
ncbi:MAG: hypothetical protein M0Z41_03915 [Peptococcaceae bacterium]|nr:hypothetical protein [Peptococcaceae bacterium]